MRGHITVNKPIGPMVIFSKGTDSQLLVKGFTYYKAVEYSEKQSYLKLIEAWFKETSDTMNFTPENF